ncbi:MAG TPA: class I SAM-dependent methyltransferase [Croceibacterium sp.]
MTAREDWQGRTGEGWAGEWRRTDRSFGGLTERLLAGTRAFSFRHALDIGCGAGELSLALARGYPHARVVGVDVSPSLLAAARSRGENISNVEFELADAAQWHPADDFTPQLLISRHGVMFFSDPPAAFANLASFAAEHAGLLFSCFRGRSENPVFTEVGSLLPAPPEPADPYAAGPFAFAERDHVSAILTDGGWTNVAFEPFDFAMVTGAGDDPVEDAMSYFQKIGPAAGALRELDQARREEILAGLREIVTDHCRDGVVALRAATWIVTARRA